MEDIHRRTIQRNYKTLVEKTNIYSLLPKLFEKKVFSQQMIESYTDSKMNELERKRELYDDIERRGPHAWASLLEALRESGHYNLYELLLNDNALKETKGTSKTTKTTTKTPAPALTTTLTPTTTTRMPSPYSNAEKLSKMTTEELYELTTMTSTKENYLMFKQMLHPPPPPPSQPKLPVHRTVGAVEVTEPSAPIEAVDSQQRDENRLEQPAKLLEDMLDIMENDDGGGDDGNEEDDDDGDDEMHEPGSGTVQMFKLPSQMDPSYQLAYETFFANERLRSSVPKSLLQKFQLTDGEFVPPPFFGDITNSSIEKFMSFSETPMKIKVRSSKRFYDCAISPPIPMYRMRGKKRGVLLIINNMNFVNDCEPRREGSQVDEQSMTELFEQFGFDVYRYRDLRLVEMRKVILEFAKSDKLRGADSVFVTVMSHGYCTSERSDTSVVATDGFLLRTDWIVNQLNNENCPLMVYKPKVFFFQACRGDSLPRRISYDGKGYIDPTREFSDILVGYCVIRGFQSHRDTKLGTWYIQIICDVFMNYAYCMQIEDLLRIVDLKMSYLRTRHGTSQTPMFENWAFNRCYLNPNYYGRGSSAAKTTDTVPFTGGALAAAQTP